MRQSIAEYNLALTYAKSYMARTYPDMPAKERLEAARRRVNKSLLALARINLARKAKLTSATPTLGGEH